MRIIPAIDIIEGKCVRLVKGDYQSSKVYNESPLEMAQQLEDHGIQFLHLVDLDGAKSNKVIHRKTLEEIATKTRLQIDFGGGIKSISEVRNAFESGATQVTIGSLAVKVPELFKEWVEFYGNDKVILGADSKNRKIAVNGWLEDSEIDVMNFIAHHVKNGVKYVTCTDIDKDGMLMGPSYELYQEILKENELSLIASGGVASFKDLERLKEIGCEGAIVGKALYEGKISLKELSKLC